MLIVKFFQFFFWTIKTQWRFVCKRWYIYRDAPLWFVAEMAGIESQEDTDPMVVKVIKLAEEELDLRISRICREMENLSKDQK